MDKMDSKSKSDGLQAAVDDFVFEEILNKKRLRVTPQRKALYRSLAGHDRPVSLKHLASSLSERMDQVTVYRNIEVFENTGIINKVYTGWKYRIELSEQFRPHHHHLTCERCGKVTPIKLGEKMESAIQSFGKRHGYKIKNHEVELHGLCKNCRKS